MMVNYVLFLPNTFPKYFSDGNNNIANILGDVSGFYGCVLNLIRFSVQKDV